MTPDGFPGRSRERRPAEGEARRRFAPRLLGALVTLAVVTAGAGEELPWTHFTPEHVLVPLPSASVQKVVQDSQGYVWLGFFSSGIARYDGHALEVFDLRDGLASLLVRELTQDRQGYLWVGCENALVVSERPLPAYQAGERPRFVSRVGTRSLPQTRIRGQCLSADPRAGVWVATAGAGLHHYEVGPQGLVEHRFSLDLSGTGVEATALAVLARQDGAVWVSLVDGTVAFLGPGASHLESPDPGLGLSSPIVAMTEGPTGTLWGGGWNGEVAALEESPQPRFLVVSSRLTEKLTDLVETPDGTVWATSLGAGLLRWHPSGRQGGELVARRQGLPSQTLWTLLHDREHNLWVGHNSGVSRLRPDFRAFGRLTGHGDGVARPLLPEPTAFSVLVPAQSSGPATLWVGTAAGLAGLAAGGESWALTVAEGLTSNSVYALAEDRRGRIWIGTPNGLSVLSFDAPPPPPWGAGSLRDLRVGGVPATVRTVPLGIIHRLISTPLARAGEDAGTRDGVCMAVSAGVGCGVVCQVGESWYFLGAAEGLPPSGVMGLAFDPNGHLWTCGGDSGVLRSRARITEELLSGLPQRETGSDPLFLPVWTPAEGAPDSGFCNLVDAGERMWVATRVGLAALGGEPVRPVLRVGRDQGLGGDTVLGMVLSPVTATLWVTDGEGLAEVDPVAGTVLRSVSKEDGLTGKEAWVSSSLAVDAAGTVYFATPQGVSLYRPDLDTSNPVPPPVVLRDVEVRRSPSGRNDVLFSYAALSYVNEQRVRFRTRLLGFDEDWSPETSETRIRYTNLPAFLVARDYTFEVTAANDAGRWSPQPARHRLSIAPPWWLSWWAAVVYGLLLVGAAHGWTALRTVRLRKRASALKEVVDQQTAELRLSLNELETLDQIVEAINRTVGLKQVMEACLDQGMKLLPQAYGGAFIGRDPGGETFHVVAVSGWDPAQALGITFRADEALQRYLAEPRGGGVFVVRGAKARPGAEKMLHLSVASSLVSIDLTVDDQILGFLVFDLSPDEDGLTASDLERLRRYRQHAVNALAKARLVSDLERANRAKSAFLAAMSHELRTPLNSIIGFSEVMIQKLGDELPLRYRRFLGNIFNSGQHLLSLINDILDLSKVEAGRMPLELEEVSVAQTVESVCRMMQGALSGRSVRLLQQVPPDLPPAVLDQGKLSQILFNLVSNAVKFSPDDTVVVISARLVAALPGSTGDDTLEITVQDQGIGIRGEDLHRIFDEFTQLDDDLARSFKGTGLGLALVKRYVEMQGGSITVESEVGKGSTFRVLLPRDASQPFGRGRGAEPLPSEEAPAPE